MKSRKTSVLLIEDEPSDLFIIRELLQELGATIAMEHAESFTQGAAMLEAKSYDVVLLDLGLPESHGIGTFEKFQERFPHLPVIVLTGLNDDEVALSAVNGGAQDYLNKGDLDANLLLRSIRYAIERNRLMQELRNASLTDQLTGLHNRRGFLLLAGHQLKSASRTGHRLDLIYLDMDGLKWINDNLGHRMGDEALIELAGLLQSTCRSSDIVARIGGDEFVILVYCDAEDSGERLCRRLEEKMLEFNREGCRPFSVEASPGIVEFDPNLPCELEELLSRADRLMYEEKKRKKKR